MSLRNTYTLIFLSSFLVFSTSLLPFSYATDTLTRGQSLKDGQTLVSAAGIFELGFFSPGNSSYRYVGVWYHNISILTVVWVANRGAPLTDSTGSLAITEDGNLVVMDGRSHILWSTNSSSTSNNSTVQLSDFGNLVLLTSDGTVSWESFNHPTDTFLPEMNLTLDRKTGKNLLFTSWKSPDDPSIGNYSLGLDPEGSAQIFMWEGSVLRWRSGQWDGQTFIGTQMRSLYLYGFKLTNDVNGGVMSFTFEPFNSTLLRFVMQYDGVENTSLLVSDPQEYWKAVWVQPVNECEIYGKCGNYGWCSESSSPICSCLKGFEPNSSEDWNNGNWSGGCVRRTQLGCELNSSAAGGNADKFSKLEGVKLPDRTDWALTVKDPVGCENFCMNNCSCKAYAYVSTIGCLTWGGDLIDIYQFSDGGNDLFIKLAASEFGGNSKIWIVIVIPILGAGAVIILIACLLLWCKYREKIKDWWKCKTREDLSRILRFSRDVIPDFSVPSEVGGEEQEVKGSELPLLSFETIAAATGDFSESNKLGQGGFGHVYKGKLSVGEVIAVKRLSTSSGQGLQEFKNEVILIAKLQHRNLVKLLGCCIEREEKILIYEYMPNRSLDAFLFDPAKQALLDWKKRFNIIEGIARGLLYLHRDSRLRIVHRDLKASNILLDEDLNPKISDFGMARIFGGDQNQENTNRVVGTYGYMSPEYAMEGLFSVKSDVYSFGILVLEIVTGRKNNSFHHLQNSPSIAGYAWPMWNEGRAMELVDPSIRNSCSSRLVLRCIHVGLLCVQDHSNDRPDMSSVLLMLGGENAILRLPKQTTFTSERYPNETGTCSTNDVTITIPSGR